MNACNVRKKCFCFLLASLATVLHIVHRACPTLWKVLQGKQKWILRLVLSSFFLCHSQTSITTTRNRQVPFRRRVKCWTRSRYFGHCYYIAKNTIIRRPSRQSFKQLKSSARPFALRKRTRLLRWRSGYCSSEVFKKAYNYFVLIPLRCLLMLTIINKKAHFISSTMLYFSHFVLQKYCESYIISFTWHLNNVFIVSLAYNKSK